MGTATAGIFNDGSPPLVVAQMSFVLFVDGFEHYQTPSQKWHEVSGNVEIVEEAGTWYDLPSTDPDHLYDTSRKRGNALKFAGTYEPGDSLPYVQMDLQHLAMKLVHVSFNMKADAFTGTPFLQMFDEDDNLVAAFAFTPEGLPHTMYDTLYTNYRFAGIGSSYTVPGKWNTLRCGIGFAVNGFALGLSIDVNKNKSLTGFGAFYNVDPAGMKVKYIRLGPAGTNTMFSDVICFNGGVGMINEANNIHTLMPQQEGNLFPAQLENGDDEYLDEYPPSTADAISFGARCQSSVFAYVVAPYNSVPVSIGIGGGTSTGGVFSFSGITDGARSSLVQPAMYGLEWQTLGTVQMNALCTGNSGAFGMFSPPYNPGGPWDWAYVFSGQIRDRWTDPDSNYLPHKARGEYHYDITQVCHHHRIYRYMWRINTFNNYWIGVMAIDRPT